MVGSIDSDTKQFDLICIDTVEVNNQTPGYTYQKHVVIYIVMEGAYTVPWIQIPNHVSIYSHGGSIDSNLFTYQNHVSIYMISTFS